MPHDLRIELHASISLNFEIACDHSTTALVSLVEQGTPRSCMLLQFRYSLREQTLLEEFQL